MVKFELSSEICFGVPEQRQQLRVEQRLQTQQQTRQHSCDLSYTLFLQRGKLDRMASLPQAAFAVHKLRKPRTDQELTVARRAMDKQEMPRYFNNQTLDLTPVKYSDKFMNSIWGLYNRYSPHNFKKNNGSDVQYFSMPQPFAVACAASDKNRSEAPTGSKKA
ncbi:uncharacterized protein LOC131693628 [Topomyia yanbarensis]|uniref:uncharacterized protein LOC131693628 n=1 Tax=Topomyia yanbarensis TaxID=2498891 RepID=UPI00273A8540|nr:uncharacterized protein LOC131693628 [Topomyia yanbarensis]